MSIAHILRKLGVAVVSALFLLSILGGMLYPQATVQAASKQRKYDFSQIIGARPLWRYSRPIAAVSGGQLPSCLTSAVLPRCFSPQQLRKAYSVQPLLAAGTTGKGHTIVLIDFSGSPTLSSDVHLYDQLFGLNDPTINVIAPFGYPAFDPGFYAETALDVEMAHVMAPDATIDLVLANETTALSPSDFLSFALQATQYAVDHNLGGVISQSFGEGETCVGSAYLQSEQKIFREAREKHITLLASSGDSGAGGLVCSGFSLNFAQAVQLPAVDPLVTSVGGTTLNAHANTGSYNSETTWNEWDQGDGATGGGFSTLFPVPSYQQGIPGVGSTRGNPDVAFDADPLTGVLVVLTEFNNTLIVPIGGTSVGAPAWAGIVTLANQHAGERLGFLNSALYRIVQSADYAIGFHDVTVGNNTITIPDNQGKPMTIPGYDAGPGWDAVTGAGTPIVSGLVPLLAKYVQSGDGSGL
jgi:subtilase family serine protease